MSTAARPHYGRTAVADKPRYVYRHYDAAGALLYVGCTADPKRRPYVKAGRPWYAQSAKVVVDGPYEWCEALELEAVTIAEGKPLHNIRQRNGSWLRREVVRLEDTLRAQGMDPVAIRAEDRRIKAAYQELYRQYQVARHALDTYMARPRYRRAKAAELQARVEAIWAEMDALPERSYLP